MILVGMDTATLRAMCGTIRANAAWSGCLPGEVPAGWSVYRIRFADGAAYVGQTHHRVVWRLAQHLSGDGSPRVLQRRNAGVAYRIDVLASGLLTERVAQRIERAEIAKLAKPLKLSGPVHRWSDPVEIATAKANTAALSLSLETLARLRAAAGCSPMSVPRYIWSCCCCCWSWREFLGVLITEEFRAGSPYHHPDRCMRCSGEHH